MNQQGYAKFAINDFISLKAFKGVSGIYKITCRASQKHYIGQAANIYGRLRSHVANLKAGKRCNKHLKRAFDLYGADQFEVEVLEKCGNLNEREKYHIDFFKSNDPNLGYNICYFDDNLNPTYIQEFKDTCSKNMSKISDSDVKVIRELYYQGYESGEIATIYRMNNAHISSIITNKRRYDPNYKKPTPSERQPLNFQERKTVDDAILRGMSLLQITSEFKINWARLNRYLKNKGRERKTKFSTIILNTVTGVYYPSVREAAETTGIPASRLQCYLTNNPHRNNTDFIICSDPSEPLKVCLNNPIILDQQSGVFYKSFKDAASAFNVTSRTMNRWLTDLKHRNITPLILC